MDEQDKFLTNKVWGFKKGGLVICSAKNGTRFNFLLLPRKIDFFELYVRGFFSLSEEVTLLVTTKKTMQIRISYFNRKPKTITIGNGEEEIQAFLDFISS